MTFWNKWLPKVERLTKTQLPNIDEIEESFRSLVDATNSVTKQAMETTKALRGRLEISERKFTMLADSVDDVILVKTINRQWVSVNKFALEVFHLDRENCIGRTNEELMVEYPHLKAVIEGLDRAEKEAWKTHSTTKLRMDIEENTQKIYLDIMITPIESSDKTVHELIIVGHNNTHYYENLKRNASDSNLFDKIEDPILIIDANNSRIYFVNNSYQSEFGVDFRKVLNNTYYDVLESELADKLSKIIGSNSDSETLQWKGYDIRVKTISNEREHSPLYFLLTFIKTEPNV